MQSGYRYPGLSFRYRDIMHMVDLWYRTNPFFRVLMIPLLEERQQGTQRDTRSTLTHTLPGDMTDQNDE